MPVELSPSNKGDAADTKKRHTNCFRIFCAAFRRNWSPALGGMASRTLRWVSGAAGVLVIALSFKWMDWFGVPYDTVLGMLGGMVVFLGTMLGVYLLFYALTGDMADGGATGISAS